MRLGVKICGLTRSVDVEQAIEAGADALGFVFDPGPCDVDERILPDLMAATRGAPVTRVAVVGEAAAEERARLFGLGFDLVQATVTADLYAAREPPPLLPAFFDGPDLLRRVENWRASRPTRRPEPGSIFGTLNVDSALGGGSGVRADWARAREMAAGGPVTLSGGLNVDNLELAIRTVRPHAVDVSSGVEAEPGIKDRQRMRAFVREVRRLEALFAEAS